MIYNCHGIVESAFANRNEYRAQIEANVFKAYLRKKRPRFVSILDALDGKGDALTIDDATQASAAAAVCAREEGHEVSLFVNPYYIVSQKPYFSSLLDTALALELPRRVSHIGKTWNLCVEAERFSFRARVKAAYRQLASEVERYELISETIRELGQAGLEVQGPLGTVSLELVRELRGIGVYIGNHGWTHGEIGAMSATLVKQEIVEGRQWIAKTLGWDADLYAVPFGETFRDDIVESGLQWLLASKHKAPGRLAQTVHNRISVKYDPEWVRR